MILLVIATLCSSRGKAQYPTCLTWIFASGFEGGTRAPWSNAPSCAETEPNNGTGNPDVLCGTVSGAISPLADRDYFRFENEVRGSSYVFAANGGPGGACGGIDPVLRIRDLADLQLAIDDNGGEDLCSRLEWTPGEAQFGPFFVDVREAGDNSTIPSYGLVTTVTMPPGSEIEPNGSIALATPYCEMLQGALNPAGDIDYASFTATSGQTIQVDTNDGIVGSCGAIDTFLIVFDPAGVQKASDDDAGVDSCSHVLFIADATGTWTAAIHEFADNGVIPFYGLEVTVTP